MAAKSSALDLAVLREDINRALASYVEGERPRFRALGPMGRMLFAEVKRSLLTPGKRIRGSLVLLGYRGYVKRGDVQRALPAAVAYELLQQYVLIHDDIIDQDDVRRGKPTTVAVMREKTKKTHPAWYREHAGNALALVTGDLLQSLVFALLARLDFPAATVMRAIGAMSRTIELVTLGEFMDVEYEHSFTGDLEPYLVTAQLKTSSYSFTGPLQLGATLAGANSATLHKIAHFGDPLGLAFQLQDDRLGIFGKPEILGKPIGSDLTEGQRTMLLLETYRRANKAEKRFLDQTIGHPITPKKLNQVRALMRSSGALGAVEVYEKKAFAQALSALPQLKLQPAIAQTLKNFVYYLQLREV